MTPLTLSLQDKHRNYDMLLRHYSDICEPYEFEKENATTGEIEIVKKLSDCLNADRSLLKMVKCFLKLKEQQDVDPEGTTTQVVDEDEDT